MLLWVDGKHSFEHVWIGVAHLTSKQTPQLGLSGPARPRRTSPLLAHLCAERSTSGWAFMCPATMASRHVSRQASPVQGRQGGGAGQESAMGEAMDPGGKRRALPSRVLENRRQLQQGRPVPKESLVLWAGRRGHRGCQALPADSGPLPGGVRLACAAAGPHLARCSPTSPPPSPSCRASRSPPTTSRTTADTGAGRAARAGALQRQQPKPQGLHSAALRPASCGCSSARKFVSGTSRCVPGVAGHAPWPAPPSSPGCPPALLRALTCTAPVLSQPRTSVQRYQYPCGPISSPERRSQSPASGSGSSRRRGEAFMRT